MQRSLAKQLVTLFLLLALIAGGEGFGASVMSMDKHGAQIGDLQDTDTSCKACGGAMTAAPCDAACPAFPALDVALVRPFEVGAHERWIRRSESGASFAIRPDPSPPRA